MSYDLNLLERKADIYGFPVQDLRLPERPVVECKPISLEFRDNELILKQNPVVAINWQDIETARIIVVPGIAESPVTVSIRTQKKLYRITLAKADETLATDLELYGGLFGFLVTVKSSQED